MCRQGVCRLHRERLDFSFILLLFRYQWLWYYFDALLEFREFLLRRWKRSDARYKRWSIGTTTAREGKVFRSTGVVNGDLGNRRVTEYDSGRRD